jgi:hypothetical protein
MDRGSSVSYSHHATKLSLFFGVVMCSSLLLAAAASNISVFVNDAAVSKAEAGLLHNENANQLTVTDELMLVKQQLAQLVQSVDTLNAKLMPASLQQQTIAAAVNSQPQQQQQSRPDRSPIPVLAQDGVLGTVFSFIGIGEYYYVAGVCRNWRGRYMALSQC